MFSTRVTGLYGTLIALDRTVPDWPELIVPNQYASTSSLGRSGVEAKHCSVASTSMSSVERPQCSPKAVQPMPTMATLSRIPLLATWPRLPEVVVDTGRRVEAPERQLQRGADLDLVGRRVGDLEHVAATAVEVDDRVDHRRRR